MGFFDPILEPVGEAPTILTAGTVWLLGTQLGEEALDRLLAAPALRAADAVLIDAGLPPGTIAYIRGVARYVELVQGSSEGRDRARRRALGLAREGWRVVRIFRREPVGTADAVLTAASLAEAGVRLRIDGVVGANLEDLETTAGRLAIALPAATESLAGVAG